MSTPSQAEVRRMIAAAGTIVVKVGSSSLTQPSGHLDPDKLDALAAALAQVRLMGGRVVLVSSGAIAAGFTGLGVGASRFAGLLGTLHTLPWADRLETLTSALTDWQGQEPQLDDICVIGFTAMPDPRKPAGDLACSSSTTPA